MLERVLEGGIGREGGGGIPRIGEDGVLTVLGEKANPGSGVLHECWRFPTLEIRDEPLRVFEAFGRAP